MRVILQTALFASAVRASDIVALFQLGLEGRHRVSPEEEWAPEYLAWLERIGELREECEEAIRLGLQEESREPALYEVQVAPVETSQWDWAVPTLALKEALDWLRCPFEVILENQQTDRLFLNAFMDPDQREFIEKRERRHWLTFKNGGGVENMANIVRSYRRQVDGRWLLTWLLSDSDSLLPETVSRSIHYLKGTCTESADPKEGESLPGKALAYQILQRRSIENYVTESALRGWLQSGSPPKSVTEDTVAAHQRMSAQQRHHYNMKKGFNGDLKRLRDDGHWQKLRDRVERLYLTLPQPDRSALEGGFGGGLGAHAFEGGVPETELRRDGSWDEVNGLISGLIGMIR